MVAIHDGEFRVRLKEPLLIIFEPVSLRLRSRRWKIVKKQDEVWELNATLKFPMHHP